MGLRAPTCGNNVKLLVANQAYDALEEAIEGAQSHIHMLYYIFETDRTGARFRDLLVKKANEGVTVRLLVDGVGSFGTSHFMIPLTQVGGKFAEFLPVGQLSRHWHPNLRNHRKIAVVDGQVGFTGGVNIGDEYTGRKRRVGKWRDAHIQVTGPAVNHLQEVFAEDWYFATGEDLISERYYPDQQPEGDQTVQIIASGPDTETQPLQRIFFTAITSAQQRIYLTTPYFVPDQAMLVALETAALRGVEVKLLLPHRSDMKLVLHAGRSYYKELLVSEVQIYEYLPGILHAKTMVVDDRWATVGSANMDVRSFKLNFEVNAMIYGPEFNKELADVFHKDLMQARKVTLEELAEKSLGSRMAEGLARVLSPVL
jgi:cardiolipin synthase